MLLTVFPKTHPAIPSTMIVRAQSFLATNFLLASAFPFTDYTPKTVFYVPTMSEIIIFVLRCYSRFDFHH